MTQLLERIMRCASMERVDSVVSDPSWRPYSMLKAWISLCHTPCAPIVPHLTGRTSYFCRSSGAIASAMNPPGAMDAAAAPKERTEVRFMTLQIAREIL